MERTHENTFYMSYFYFEKKGAGRAIVYKRPVLASLSPSGGQRNKDN